MVRTRIAPSPTGEDIHIGNLYTALINFVYAQKNNGQFVIRIEDTDRTRLVEGSENKILSSLNAFGITHDEGPDNGGPYAPYRQSDRKDLYKKYAEDLVEKGHAYYCFCSKERLDQIRKDQIEKKQLPRYDKHCLTNASDAQTRVANAEAYVIRLNVIPDQKIIFTDLIRGEIEFDSNQVDDQVLLKSDGFPTYHLGVVVDDYLMKISHVIRAEEWITSTPKHILLYEAFGWQLPVFAHVPILRNPDKSKLSKRKNPVWASWYLQEGFLPEAVLNFLALMGWSHPDQKEIFDLEEFKKFFDLKDIKPVGPVFDVEKLKWVNQQHIMKLKEGELVEKLKVFYKGDREVLQVLEGTDLATFGLLIGLVQTRIRTLKDFKELLTESVGIPRNEAEKIVVSALRDQLSAITEEEWNKDRIFEIFKSVMTENSIKMPILYYLFTGKERGLPLPEMLQIWGKEKTLQKLSH